MSTKVIKRDEYKAGMTVRMRDGRTDVLEEDDCGNYSLVARREHFAYTRRGFYWYTEDEDERDIIGEVVNVPETAPIKQNVTSATTIKTTYSDGMEIVDGAWGSLSKDEIREKINLYRRALARCKAQDRDYGRATQ